MDIRQLQREVGEWHRRNFPEASIVEIALKAAEEVGELAAACGKLYSGIGDRSDLWAKERDAIGDIAIVLAAYCQKAGIVMELAIEETWQQVSKRDWIADPIRGGKDRDAEEGGR